MNEVCEVLELVAAAGGRLMPDGERLRVRAPHALPKELMEALHRHIRALVSAWSALQNSVHYRLYFNYVRTSADYE